MTTRMHAWIVLILIYNSFYFIGYSEQWSDIVAKSI